MPPPRLGTLLVVTLPVMAGYVPLGMVYGYLFSSTGAELWLVLLLSLVVFAGAMQFLLVGFLASGAELFEIVLACVLVNARHVFYGVSVRELLPAKGLKRWYCVHALTDETYALLTGLESGYARGRSFEICLVNQVYWLVGSGAGVALGLVLSPEIPGLEFTLVALFTVLAVELYCRRPERALLVAAVLSYVVAGLVLPEHPLLLAMVLGLGVVAWRGRLERGRFE